MSLMTYFVGKVVSNRVKRVETLSVPSFFNLAQFCYIDREIATLVSLILPQARGACVHLYKWQLICETIF
jgi:hypothetical protein